MGLTKVPKLDSVLYVTEEDVGVGQTLGLVGLDVVMVAEGFDRIEGRLDTQVGVEPPVNQLKKLNRELDIPNSSSRPFEIGAGCGILCLGFEKTDTAESIDIEALIPNDPVRHFP